MTRRSKCKDLGNEQHTTNGRLSISILKKHLRFHPVKKTRCRQIFTHINICISLCLTSSTITTSSPRASRVSATQLPMNPAAPVTRTVFFPVCGSTFNETNYTFISED